MAIIAGITGAVGGFIVGVIFWLLCITGLFIFYEPANWELIGTTVLVGVVGGVIAGVGPRWSEANIVYGVFIGILAAGFIVIGFLGGEIIYSFNVITVIALVVISSIYPISIGVAFYFAD